MNAITRFTSESKQLEVDNSECIKCLRYEDECRFKATHLKSFARSGEKPWFLKKKKHIKKHERLPVKQAE
ncbi:hypothetical protein Pmgp_01796 [Pelotomaculum propionicicum]|uniref:Uncharacterized protein n=1 Tax=Pelotomaculum propionicicum TaxID=258475 RepID=A0A4Y7RQZ4_9FIRM|nr:hypothetical protein Pmgp_01796 [Pelotomaculum propionicicum]